MIPSRPLDLSRRLLLQWWHTTCEMARYAVRRTATERIFEVAASLTFTTILSMVPLVTTVFAVMTAFPVFVKMRDALHSFMSQSLMPASISVSIFNYLDQFAANAKGLTAVGVISFGVTSIMTMLTIDGALNMIWGVKRPRPLSQRVLVYWAILTAGPIVLGVSLSLTSYLASASAGFVTAPPPVTATAIAVLPVVLLTLSYAALYVYVPNRRVEWRDALAGGFVAALAFEFAKRGFALYVTSFPTYTLIYGALAAIPLLLLWVYYIWIITLVGATIAASLPALYGRHWNRGLAPGDTYADALRVLRLLARARKESERSAGVAAHQLRAQARLDYEAADEIFEKLEQDGLVVRTRQIASDRRKRFRNDDLWLLAADPRVVTLGRVFRLFAFDPDHVAAIGLDRDDPLADLLRRQRLVDDDLSLEDAFDSNSLSSRIEVE